MESALTVFDQSVNLVVLAQSTKAALDLLAPWYQSKHSSKTLILISRQAELYVHAVNSSILASQRGFTIADEAINLFEVLQSNNIEGSKDMEIQKQEYLNTMFELAVRGHELTKEALNKFRNVRQTVLRLIQEAKNEDHGSEDPTSIIKLSNLENSISILEDFSENMSQYASWWNRMEMMQSAQKTSTEMFMKYANNALRQQTVVQKWMKLREEYVQYTEKIRAVQDSHSSIFADPAIERPNKPSSVISIMEECESRGAGLRGRLRRRRSLFKNMWTVKVLVKFLF